MTTPRAADGRRGRRPGPSTTREEILRAARAQFADAGYDRTTVRAIARSAQVDPALVIQFFGSKEELFRAVIGEFGELLAGRMQQIATVPGTLGERLAQVYLSAWQEPATRTRAMAILRSVGTNSISVDTMVGAFVGKVWPMMSAELGREDVDDVMAPIASILIGTAVTRFILDLPFAPRSVEALVATTAPIIDGIVDRARRPAQENPGQSAAIGSVVPDTHA